MILASFSIEDIMLHPGSYQTSLASYLSNSLEVEENRLTSSHHLLNHLETCGIDLEPLPLFSPTCFDTLRAVNPKVFESNMEEDELLKPACPWTMTDPEATLEDDQEEESFETDLQGPSGYDVVCSRAKHFYHMPGCQRFRQIVRAAIPAYMRACTRLDKSSVIASTIDMVIHHPEVGHIRFWKYNSTSDTWMVLGSDQIRDKVGHALREMMQEMKRTQRKNMDSIRQVVARAS